MPRVFIPPLLKPLTGGVDTVEVRGATVREAIAELDAKFPGLRARLCDGDELKPGLTVVVDGHVSPLGILQPIGENSELHFLPAIGGG